ncbi:hypothetical protein CO660_16900 [Rhizobium sp. L9]|nr:hypothetical protein CO660_16900 [Rhizobium sp. L9]
MAPLAALLRSVANTFNATRSSDFNDCGERLSGSWEITNDAESVLAFTSHMEMWQCVTIPQPVFKGIVVRMEQKTIKTKLYSFKTPALFQTDTRTPSGLQRRRQRRPGLGRKKAAGQSPSPSPSSLPAKPRRLSSRSLSHSTSATSLAKSKGETT